VVKRVALLAFVALATACATVGDDVDTTPEATVTPPPSNVPPTSSNPTTSTPPATVAPVTVAPVTVAPTTTRPPRSLTIIAGGDVLNEGWVDQAGRTAAAPGERFNFIPLFAPVASIISAADLAICHAELPIGRPEQSSGVYGRSPFGGNLLLAPFEIASALAATGFDRCSTASNHSYDLGDAGIISTLDALDAAGISSVGTARTPDDTNPPLIDVAGIGVGHLSFTKNWNTVPPQGWMLDRAISVEQVAGDVADVRAAGAELVIVSLHVGKELLTEPTAADRAFVTDLTAASLVDLVIVHGPHVIQPYEVVNGTPVYWSLGNFVSGMGRPGTGRYEDLRTLDGLLASVRFTEGAPGSFSAEAQAVLICNEQQSRVVRAPIRELASSSGSEQTRAELQRCIDRTVPIEADIS
jgi:poly-gamma-glutamate capsule biosynthesis protein CapA/YwtB (metallophosphatase superfamily)